MYTEMASSTMLYNRLQWLHAYGCKYAHRTYINSLFFCDFLFQLFIHVIHSIQEFAVVDVIVCLLYHLDLVISERYRTYFVFLHTINTTSDPYLFVPCDIILLDEMVLIEQLQCRSSLFSSSVGQIILLSL